MHYFRENPSKSPYISIKFDHDPPKMDNMMTPVYVQVSCDRSAPVSSLVAIALESVQAQHLVPR